MSNSRYITTALVEEVIPGTPMELVEIAVDDKAATREAIIRMVRAQGHEFVERSGWRARPPKSPSAGDWDYSMIALHHAGRSYSCGNGSEQMLDTQKLQQGKDDFNDIGYHYGIDCSGNVYEGLDIRHKGSNLRLFNTGVIGVVLLNNLTTVEEGRDLISVGRKVLSSIGVGTTNQIPALQLDATLNLINALKSVFVINQFGGHKEYPGQKDDGKICPGHIAMDLVKAIRVKTKLLPPPRPWENY